MLDARVGICQLLATTAQILPRGGMRRAGSRTPSPDSHLGLHRPGKRQRERRCGTPRPHHSAPAHTDRANVIVSRGAFLGALGINGRRPRYPDRRPVHSGNAEDDDRPAGLCPRICRRSTFTSVAFGQVRHTCFGCGLLAVLQFYGRASRIMLNGVSVALHTRPKPPSRMTADSFPKPACAPSAVPTG